ncbi:DEAD/DEAH box helicase [Rhizobium sp. YTU87027]|uniref:DEAD/DEAH box helicase n=1 Tax=Rhizobium sp. YTU87027 TaxID=3417741 RepID=UPI003D6831EB
MKATPSPSDIKRPPDVPLHGSEMHQQVARILSYWEHIEHYSPPILESDGDKSASVSVAHIVNDHDPWPQTEENGNAIRHFIRFGVAPVRECDDLLIRRWSTGANAPDDRTCEETQFTFAGAFAVSDKKTAEPGSLVINRFLYDLAVATERTQISFADYAEALATEYKARVKARLKPVAIAEALADLAFSTLGLPAKVRAKVKCVVVTSGKPIIKGKASRKPRDAKPFNNVYPGLLRELRSDVVNGVVIGAAWDLLTLPSAASDFDATSDAAVLNSLETDRYPSARWPSDFSLSPQQQVAVNELFARLSKEGVFSINGPPGTGKTTLLLDVVAGILGRRAEVLLDYDDPLSAFTPVYGEEGCTHFRIDRQLDDFLVAVASSNNGAVANLTLELPKRSKIGRAYSDTVNFLPKLAERLMAQHQLTSQSWGAISVPLGNRQNRDRCSTAMAEAIDDDTLFEGGTDSWDDAKTDYRAAKARLDEIRAKHLSLSELVNATKNFEALYPSLNQKWTLPVRSTTGTAAIALEPGLSATHPVLIQAREQIERLREELGDVVLPGEFAEADHQAQAQMLPGTSTAFERARCDMFIAAMRLHQSFVAHAWASIRPNLVAWIDLISAKARAWSEAAARDLWSTFSLLVPVVSSTFCSFSNVFGSMGRGSIPWLIVDEAGQASSQHAIDALSRAKRAIVVGDPFQLEPISTISHAVETALATKFGIAPQFRTKHTSLQTLADRINPFGAKRKGTWVGAPLRVHRRCLEPMFSISNGLAYDRSMILADEILHNASKDVRRPSFGPSAWINVVGAAETANDFYIPQEGAVAAHIMSRCVARTSPLQPAIELPDILIISPFRKVAEGFKQHLRDNAPAVFGETAAGTAEEWIERSVGTVHSFQGKEADTVILILGATRPDSIDWVLAKPNIMNVAVTRARRRLYIIGNRANWYRDPVRDAWMLGTEVDWLMEEGEARQMFDSSASRKPMLRVVK